MLEYIHLYVRNYHWDGVFNRVSSCGVDIPVRIEIIYQINLIYALLVPFNTNLHL
jgi:hypothetical protein